MRSISNRLFKKIKAEIVLWIEGMLANFPYSGLGNSLRRVYWGRKLNIPGIDIAIFPGVKFLCTETLRIGIGVSINFNTIINSYQGYITIGDNVLIGPNCVLRAADHIFVDPGKLIKTQGHRGGNIIIEDDCWLGVML
jgi:acetyltransferase-like isoleucine patch superfamily enzyme